MDYAYVPHCACTYCMGVLVKHMQLLTSPFPSSPPTHTPHTPPQSTLRQTSCSNGGDDDDETCIVDYPQELEFASREHGALYVSGTVISSHQAVKTFNATLWTQDDGFTTRGLTFKLDNCNQPSPPPSPPPPPPPPQPRAQIEVVVISMSGILIVAVVAVCSLVFCILTRYDCTAIYLTCTDIHYN